MCAIVWRCIPRPLDPTFAGSPPIRRASRSAAAFWRSILRAFQRFPWPQRPKARGWRPAILPRRASATPLPLGCTARVVAESIQDNPENQTAFALVGRLVDAELLRGSRYKTSLALFLRADKPGALQMILSEFAYAGINLTMLQSRPTKKQLGEYMFFVELDGSMHDIDVQTALDCLRLKLREVKVLGSYPVE